MHFHTQFKWYQIGITLSVLLWAIFSYFHSFLFDNDEKRINSMILIPIALEWAKINKSTHWFDEIDRSCYYRCYQSMIISVLWNSYRISWFTQLEQKLQPSSRIYSVRLLNVSELAIYFCSFADRYFFPRRVSFFTCVCNKEWKIWGHLDTYYMIFHVKTHRISRNSYFHSHEKLSACLNWPHKLFTRRDAERGGI